MSNKAFNQEQIAHCVQLLDELARSGVGVQAFAQARGVSYTELRAWRNHESRWRARLAGQQPAKAPVRANGFVQAHPGTVAVHPVAGEHGGRSVRIECSQGGRSAVLHWPADAPVPCAQWLAAYLAQ
jgi:hypothetical protein